MKYKNELLQTTSELNSLKKQTLSNERITLTACVNITTKQNDELWWKVEAPKVDTVQRHDHK